MRLIQLKRPNLDLSSTIYTIFKPPKITFIQAKLFFGYKSEEI